MNTRPKFGTWYLADEAPPNYVGILIAGFECGDREPVIADGFYDGERFRTHYLGSTVIDEVLAWMPKPEFPTGSKHWHTLPPKSVCPGQRLFTRDGRTIGNAIVTEIVNGLVRIETDFGNGGSLLSLKEVNDWWHTTDKDGNVSVTELEQWRRERQLRLSVEQLRRDTEELLTKHILTLLKQ